MNQVKPVEIKLIYEDALKRHDIWKATGGKPENYTDEVWFWFARSLCSFYGIQIEEPNI
jgi:hypothetical protein